MKKRAAAFLLAGILSMSMLAGCGSGNDGQGGYSKRCDEGCDDYRLR